VRPDGGRSGDPAVHVHGETNPDLLPDPLGFHHHGPGDRPGPWIGRWVSGHNGHEGPLWCIVTPTPDKPGSYDFRYRAGWGMLQFGNYVHTVAVKKDAAGNLLVKGKMDLPKLFGEHSLDGVVTASEFNADFKSEKGDHGKMTLRRPGKKAK